MVSLNAIFNVLSNDVHGDAISKVYRHVGPAEEGHTQACPFSGGAMLDGDPLAVGVEFLHERLEVIVCLWHAQMPGCLDL
jgi:hypothetical protein